MIEPVVTWREIWPDDNAHYRQMRSGLESFIEIRVIDAIGHYNFRILADDTLEVIYA